jgi:hypothetical protein
MIYIYQINWPTSMGGVSSINYCEQVSQKIRLNCYLSQSTIKDKLLDRPEPHIATQKGYLQMPWKY